MLIDTKKLKKALDDLGVTINPLFFKTETITLGVLQFALQGEEKALNFLADLERRHILETKYFPLAIKILRARRDPFIIYD